MSQSRAEPAFSLGVVILGAGRSVRMGRPKLLLPWGGTSILGHLLEQWRTLGALQIAVVYAADAPVVQRELDRLGVSAEHRIENPHADRGMFSSIQCAARWKRWQLGLTHWAIALGDQPHLRVETLQAALNLAASHPQAVAQPAHGGHPRHPVLLPKPIFLELATSNCSSLKEFLLAYQVAVAELDDPGLNLDLDRPEDYVKALTLAACQPPSPRTSEPHRL